MEVLRGEGGGAGDVSVAGFGVEPGVDEARWDEGLDGDEFQLVMDDVVASLRGECGDLPAREVQGGLDAARRGLRRAALSGDEVVQVLDEQLVACLEEVGRVQAQAEAVAFTLAREAYGRGLHTQVGLSLVDWLRVRIPWLSTEAASRVAVLARLGASPTGAVLADAVTRGEVAVHRGAVVARTLLRLESSLDPDQRQAYTDLATAAAARVDLADRDLAVVCQRLVHDLLIEAAPGERERAAHELRTITHRTVGPGLTRFTIDAPDSAAATLDGVLTCHLAAPAPGPSGEPDERTPGQRRFDALLAVIGRGLSRPGAAPSSARAAVILMIPFDQTTGTPTGPATTATGAHVPARQAAQLACTADVTPIWLSTDREPLVLGRTARYATPGQWKALAARDGGCTFAGCSTPPQWCDSHHLHGWARGGHTDTTNLALLCGRHHTLVHQLDLHATITGGTVRWHT
ncbi:DUF222 domain-containing protein [Ornithinimicrobium sp. LYQ92]|uniref:HNH endonuclease signature motif containing protein n=1 Tax=Serinicoccus sp. LYQ92 TaxID=3378798 RepID=UPI003853DF5F